jgi:hypothetical protein
MAGNATVSYQQFIEGKGVVIQFEEEGEQIRHEMETNTTAAPCGHTRRTRRLHPGG